MSGQNNQTSYGFERAVGRFCARAFQYVFAVALLGFLPATFLSAEPNDKLPTIPKVYVLLRNGSVLTGDVKRVGNQISISQPDGSSVRLSASEISVFAASMRGIYQHRRSRRIDGDLRGLQDDIRWSLRHGLVREAALDALLARQLDPVDATTKHLISQVAMRMRQEVSPKSARPTSSPQRLPSVRTVSHEDPLSSSSNWKKTPATLEHQSEPKKSDSEDPEWISERTKILFLTRIQPILTNRCSSCHSRTQSLTDGAPVDSFQLHDAATVRLANETAGKENLRSLLSQVDLESPLTSPLRAFALDEHGGRLASLGPEDSVMMTTLDQWLQLLAKDHESERLSDAILGPDPTNETDGEDVSLSTPTQESNSFLDTPAKFERRTEPANLNTSNGRVRRMPELENPFDPAIFNRRYHGIDAIEPANGHRE
ncbi:MAG: hypothetical protein AAF802_07715 [Planctomycetota bacterium]